MSHRSILIIGAVWVEPNSSAAGKRMLQLIAEFLDRGFSIIFASAAVKSAKAIDLTSLGIKEVSIQLNCSSFDEFLKELQPQIVMFDRFMIEEQFGWRVAENCPNAIRILDTEDLHCLRKTREVCVQKQKDFSIDALLHQDITKREIAAILRCDLSLIISTFEMDLLKDVFRIDEAILLYLPFLFNEIDASHQKKWKSFQERTHFVFIGNFFHKPNVDAVLTLKNKIWKTVRKKIPDAEIHIYGAYVNQQIQQLHNSKEGFLIKGFVENANEVISQYKVVLAPINFGAGIKGKLTEAMICGTPSVTTSLGVEGMHKDLYWNGFVEDDFEEFSKKAVILYSEAKTWKMAQHNGVNIINSIYNLQKNGVLFFNKIEEIQSNFTQHRTQNFLGRLLQHQTLQATKYMSKWIEEKNKL